MKITIDIYVELSTGRVNHHSLHTPHLAITRDVGPGRHDVSFAGTKLEGVDFSIRPNGVGDGIENSTIHYYPGLVIFFRSSRCIKIL